MEQRMEPKLSFCPFCKKETAKRNTSYKIIVESPLLRSGIKIESGPVSEGYLVEETKKLLKFVREINSGE